MAESVLKLQQELLGRLDALEKRVCKLAVTLSSSQGMQVNRSQQAMAPKNAGGKKNNGGGKKKKNGGSKNNKQQSGKGHKNGESKKQAEVSLAQFELKVDQIDDRYDKLQTEKSDLQKSLEALIAKTPAISKSLLVRTPSSYYNWTLRERAVYLQAPNGAMLCKSIVMRNQKFRPAEQYGNRYPEGAKVSDLGEFEGYEDRTYSRWYQVIVPYISRLSNERLIAVLRDLREGDERLGKKKFNFRLVDETVSNGLSGYGHNAVTPLGMKHPIPIVLSDLIPRIPQGYFFLGGGEVDVKWRVSVDEFIKQYNPIIGAITYDDFREF